MRFILFYDRETISSKFKLKLEQFFQKGCNLNNKLQLIDNDKTNETTRKYNIKYLPYFGVYKNNSMELITELFVCDSFFFKKLEKVYSNI